jgi:hypothetical protein
LYTEVEDVLEFFSTFDNFIKTLALLQGPQRFHLIPAMMGHNAQKMILQALTVSISPNKDLKTALNNSCSYILEEDILLDIKEWMSEVKKP